MLASSAAKPSLRLSALFRQGAALWVLALINCALVAGAFHNSVAATLDVWMNSPEYNYGLLVPVVVALMLWRDLGRSTAPQAGGWWGVGLVGFGLLLGLIEALSQTRFPGQVGLFLSLIGIYVAWQGEARSRATWPGLVFLLFGLPMANGIQVILTGALQMVSSIGAVALIRLADIPVLREGNVIDLGPIQLQVAEACSGLRYLFPLATFSFLCAYLYIGHPVKKAVIFLSSIPITIVMNIVRIGVTGLLVDRFGVAAAEGFFHDFEGWIIYCACLAILAVEMKLLCYIGGHDRSLLRRLDLDLPPSGGKTAPVRPAQAAPGLAVAFLAFLTLLLVVAIGTRPEHVPVRNSFALFPREIGAWQGVEAPVDADSLRALNASDHLSVNFARNDGALINTWIAYYSSQYSGNAAHSPLVCMPGGGWQIEQAGVTTLNVSRDGATTAIPVNRIIIAQGNTRQLVYYWFVEGGAIETNEYRAKARLFANAVMENRRDGALVRFVAPISGTDIAAVDAQMQSFIAELLPVLPTYLP
ncbi:VPLPA-CTERM-specific exosortase XrtD [Dongia rigui]|uniref:VPLPA-CTERM-specific exosortase XrtD n=1 Tax=Dongia rigui TaxID=940149 RepID=A0ABU5DZ42_9PROT|nr:VPLPA-CTERM-specific exosortase XrtD [Dongia rigui]MDY0872560.1 VPLPA-CTERM-specific exosortase XrtD [Dongia rigui]